MLAPPSDSDDIDEEIQESFEDESDHKTHQSLQI